MASRKQRERKRGTRRENRHERRRAQHSSSSDWDCVIVPSGLPLFKPEADKTYHIDVIPYIVGGKNKNANEGDEYFELSYPVYNELGIDQKRYVAIGEMLGVRDPVAEHFAVLNKAGRDWDDIKQFKPKWRQLMLFFVHEEADKGLQLFEGAYGTFGELLDEEIESDELDYIENFDDPDAGATLEVRFKAKPIGQKNPWIKASKINFIERESGFDANGDEDLAIEIMEKATSICLDNCLKYEDYASLKAILDGEPVGLSDKDEVDDPPAKTGRKVRKPKQPEKEEVVEQADEVDEGTVEEGEIEDAKVTKPKTKTKTKSETEPKSEVTYNKGDEVESIRHGACTVLKVTDNGTLTLIDEDDEVHFDVPISDISVPVDDEPETEAPKKTSKTTKKTAKAEKVDDDWDEDWD